MVFGSVLALLTGCFWPVPNRSMFAIKLDGENLIVLTCASPGAVTKMDFDSRTLEGKHQWQTVISAWGSHTFQKKESFVATDPPGFTTTVKGKPSFEPNHQLALFFTFADGSRADGLFTFSADSRPDARTWMYVDGTKSERRCTQPIN